jgi:YD repeat-containing protein
MGRGEKDLDRLLDLDGFLAEVGGGFWVKIVAQQVALDVNRPHGVRYSLTLHDPRGQRVFGLDNAHVVRLNRGPAGRSSAARDHLHRGGSVRRYMYRGADRLIEDFWREVEAILEKAGVE